MNHNPTSKMASVASVVVLIVGYVVAFLMMSNLLYLVMTGKF